MAWFRVHSWRNSNPLHNKLWSRTRQRSLHRQLCSRPFGACVRLIRGLVGTLRRVRKISWSATTTLVYTRQASLSGLQRQLLPTSRPRTSSSIFRGQLTATSHFSQYLEAAHGAISSMLGVSLENTVSGRSPPFQVTIQPSSACAGGIPAAAANGQLTYCAGIWGVNRLMLLVVPHELVNLMTGGCVTGGWPREWWADDKSPFPRFVATTFMRTQGYAAEADAASDVDVANGPTFQLHKTIVESFSWTPYKEMFALFRQLKINLGAYSEPLKSAVIAASLIRFGVPQKTMLDLLRAANITDVTNEILTQANRAALAIFP